MIFVLLRRSLQIWRGDELDYHRDFACWNVSSIVASRLGEFDVLTGSSCYSGRQMFTSPGGIMSAAIWNLSCEIIHKFLSGRRGDQFLWGRSHSMPCSLCFITVARILRVIHHSWEIYLLCISMRIRHLQKHVIFWNTNQVVGFETNESTHHRHSGSWISSPYSEIKTSTRPKQLQG